MRVDGGAASEVEEDPLSARPPQNRRPSSADQRQQEEGAAGLSEEDTAHAEQGPTSEDQDAGCASDEVAQRLPEEDGVPSTQGGASETFGADKSAALGHAGPDTTGQAPNARLRRASSVLTGTASDGPGLFDSAGRGMRLQLADATFAQARARRRLRSSTPSLTLSRQELLQLQAVAQVERKFIVARVGSSLLLLVDQHAAGERVELERLQEQVLGAAGGGGVESVALDEGVPLAATTVEHRWMAKHRQYAERWGFRYALRGDAEVVVTHIPEVLGTRLAPADLRSLIAEAERSGGAVTGRPPRAVLHILTFKACRRAVKFGDPLTPAAMASLLSALTECRQPFQCAHGRPTIYPCLDVKAFRQAARGLQGTSPASGRGTRAPPLAAALASLCGRRASAAAAK